MYQFLLFFQPFILLSIMFFLRKLNLEANSDKFVVSSAVISMWSYVLYSSGSALIIQKWTDTLKLLIAAPVSLFEIIFVKSLSNSLIALISMAISFFYARFIFHFNIGIENYGLFLLAVISLVFSLCVVGLILAIVFAAFQNVFDFQNLILSPIILICGVFIPVGDLPLLVQPLAYFLPMTWGINSVYLALEMVPNIYQSIFITVGMSLIYLLIAYFLIQKMEISLRKNGKWGAI